MKSFLLITFLVLFSSTTLAGTPASPALASPKATPRRELQRGEPDWVDARCPGSGDPAPVNQPADLDRLIRILGQLKNAKGEHFLVMTPKLEKDLKRIFDPGIGKTKIEQFYQLMYVIQENLPKDAYSLEVMPEGIKEALLAAKVFRDETFPKRINRVRVERASAQYDPYFFVSFDHSEVRFTLNEGRGFAMWKNGKCQVARQLVFYDDFSFRVKEKPRSHNLLVYDFDKAQLFGDFGNRGILDIDLNYVDLEKVEFINGTDEGKVTVRVAKREFETNEHSGLFKFVGRLIPNTSQQRIDW